MIDILHRLDALSEDAYYADFSGIVDALVELRIATLGRWSDLIARPRDECLPRFGECAYLVPPAARGGSFDAWQREALELFLALRRAWERARDQYARAAEATIRAEAPLWRGPTYRLAYAHAEAALCDAHAEAPPWPIGHITDGRLDICTVCWGRRERAIAALGVTVDDISAPEAAEATIPSLAEATGTDEEDWTAVECYRAPGGTRRAIEED